ncbi:MAG: hypothetical protein ABTQ32_13365 [Myxococcaceae bacterium]
MTLSVAATSPDGSPLTYQWFKGTQAVLGATADTYTPAVMPFSLTPISNLYSVTVTNGTGSTPSQAAQVALGSLRSWREVGPVDGANPTNDGPFTVIADATGRTHIISSYTEAGVTRLRVTEFSADDDTDTNWNCCGVSFAMGGMPGAGSITSVRAAAAPGGTLFITWDEVQSTPLSGTTGRVVRAAVYQPPPANMPRARGTWTGLGNVSDPTQEGSAPAVAPLGPGAYEIAWLERPTAASVRSGYARRYTVPAMGSPTAQTFTAVEGFESTNDPVNGPLTLVSSNGATWVAFYLANSATPRWQANHRPAGSLWTPGAPSDIAVASGFAKILSAVNTSGVALLATATTTGLPGRLYVRRLNVVTGAWLDTAWTYSANAYGSDPALLIDDTGRCDIFGVYVETNLGYTSQLIHWTRPPAGAWVSRGALVNNTGNFSTGDGLKTPVAGRDAAGNLVLGFTNRVPGGLRASRSLRYSAASDTWSALADIVPLTSTGIMAQEGLGLAVSSNGAATAVVGRPDSGATSLYRARLR